MLAHEHRACTTSVAGSQTLAQESAMHAEGLVQPWPHRKYDSLYRASLYMLQHVADLLHDPGFPPVLMINWHWKFCIPGTASHAASATVMLPVPGMRKLLSAVQVGVWGITPAGAVHPHGAPCQGDA